jgi:hypothetical protein
MTQYYFSCALISFGWLAFVTRMWIEDGRKAEAVERASGLRRDAR